jgi:hypothetical protein
MNEYLVRSHLGGFYISDGEPEYIEMYCETCGDYDQIEASWNSEDENGKIKALSDYLSIESIKSIEDLNNRIFIFDDDTINKKEIYENIIDEVFFNYESSYELINYLHEDGYINSKELKELKSNNIDDLKNQLEIIKEQMQNIDLTNNELKSLNKTLTLKLEKGNEII